MGKPFFAWVCCVPLPPTVLWPGGQASAGTWLPWLPPILGDPGTRFLICQVGKIMTVGVAVRKESSL